MGWKPSGTEEILGSAHERCVTERLLAHVFLQLGQRDLVHADAEARVEPGKVGLRELVGTARAQGAGERVVRLGIAERSAGLAVEELEVVQALRRADRAGQLAGPAFVALVVLTKDWSSMGYSIPVRRTTNSRERKSNCPVHS